MVGKTSQSSEFGGGKVRYRGTREQIKSLQPVAVEREDIKTKRSDEKQGVPPIMDMLLAFALAAGFVFSLKVSGQAIESMGIHRVVEYSLGALLALGVCVVYFKFRWLVEEDQRRGMVRTQESNHADEHSSAGSTSAWSTMDTAIFQNGWRMANVESEPYTLEEPKHVNTFSSTIADTSTGHWGRSEVLRGVVPIQKVSPHIKTSAVTDLFFSSELMKSLTLSTGTPSLDSEDQETQWMLEKAQAERGQSPSSGGQVVRAPLSSPLLRSGIEALGGGVQSFSVSGSSTGNSSPILRACAQGGREGADQVEHRRKMWRGEAITQKESFRKECLSEDELASAHVSSAHSSSYDVVKDCSEISMSGKPRSTLERVVSADEPVDVDEASMSSGIGGSQAAESGNDAVQAPRAGDAEGVSGGGNIPLGVHTHVVDGIEMATGGGGAGGRSAQHQAEGISGEPTSPTSGSRKGSVINSFRNLSSVSGSFKSLMGLMYTDAAHVVLERHERSIAAGTTGNAGLTSPTLTWSSTPSLPRKNSDDSAASRSRSMSLSSQESSTGSSVSTDKGICSPKDDPGDVGSNTLFTFFGRKMAKRLVAQLFIGSNRRNSGVLEEDVIDEGEEDDEDEGEEGKDNELLRFEN